MRHNLPVTDQEFPFPAGQTLVSTTDTKGRILYCNTAFISQVTQHNAALVEESAAAAASLSQQAAQMAETVAVFTLSAHLQSGAPGPARAPAAKPAVKPVIQAPIKQSPRLAITRAAPRAHQSDAENRESF